MDNIYNINCLELNEPQDIMGLAPITNTSHNKWKEPLDFKACVQELKYVFK